MKTLAFAMLILLSVPAYGQITKIQNASSDANNAVSSVTVSALTSGSAVIASVFWCDNAGCNASITGETAAVTATGCTFTEEVSGVNTGSFRTLKTFKALNCSAGATTVTSTITGGSDTHYHAIMVSEYSGIATASAVDQTNTDTDTEGTTQDISTDGATTQNDELVYAAIAIIAAAILTPDPDFTELNDRGTLHDQYRVVSSTGVQTSEWGTDGTAEAIKNILTLKAATGAGGGRPLILGLKL